MPKKLIDLDLLKDFRQKYDERLKNGTLVPSKSLTAKELETVSPESGDTQETPFMLQGTGTANGTSSVDTGSVGKHIQKQGSVYCVNQLAKALTDDNWSANNSTATFNNGVATFTATAQNGDIRQTQIHFSSYHTYLIAAYIKLNTATTEVSVRLYGENAGYTAATTNWQIVYGIVTTRVYEGNPTSFLIRDNRSSGWDAIQVKTPILVDLTQWFNGNIPQDLLDHPENAGKYGITSDLAYNTGTLVASNGRYLVCGGRNIWDEVTEIGTIDETTGQNSPNSSMLRTKNYISVVPNGDYYFRESTAYWVCLYFYDENKNFISSIWKAPNQTITIPSTAFYLRFRLANDYGTTYKNDITISLYYAGEDYSQYYPYVEPKVYDTGTETLLSTGVKLSVGGEREDIYDYKEPNGTITRRVGSYTFTGNESWSYNSGSSFWYCNTISGFRSANGSNLLFSNGIVAIITGNDTIRVYLSYNPQITSSTNMNTIFPSGTVMNYELATPTTEQGTPFSENIEIDDFGTMGWYSAYTDSNTNTLVSVPQGCKIFYPAWYVGFIDTLGQRADIDWNANNVVSQNELQDSETARDTIDSQLQNAIGGTLRQCLCVAQSLSFDNTAFVDLGDLTFDNVTEGNATTTTSLNTVIARPSGSNVSPKMICTKYKTVSRDDLFNNTSITCNTSGNIIIYDATLAGKTGAEVKAAMKGVLLAYEKAS